MIKCEELLKLKNFKNIELIAGEKGVDKVITWPYTKHTREIYDWVHGGELLLMSGFEEELNDEYIQKILTAAHNQKLSGVLIEGGHNFESINEETIALANQYSLPLFWTPKPVNFVDITREISNLIMEESLSSKRCNQFLERVYTSTHLDDEIIASWADDFHIKLEKVFALVLIKTVPKLSKEPRRDPSIDFDIESIHRTIKTSIENFIKQDISRISWDSISYLITADSFETLDKHINNFMSLREILENYYDKYDIYLSVGRYYTNLSDINKSYSDANKTMKLLLSKNYMSKTAKYNEIGSYRLLFNIDNKDSVISFRDDMLLPLYKYDQKNKSDLLATLEIYLNSNGNMSSAAESLVIHRNTLQFRLDKIKHILNVDLNDPRIRQDFMNAYMILTFHPF